MVYVVIWSMYIQGLTEVNVQVFLHICSHNNGFLFFGVDCDTNCDACLGSDPEHCAVCSPGFVKHVQDVTCSGKYL